MTIAELLLPEFEQEMATTRRVLDRVPDSRFVWKPHDKSWTMGELASHIVNTVSWTDVTMNESSFDLATVSPEEMNRAAKSRTELLAWFDGNVASARQALAKADEEYFVPWTLKQGDQIYFTMPRYTCVRSFCLNHIVHHRAQLGVYLRLNNIAVPAMYGPSADEQN
jgi:uncharacterized damage-inducible protein DinB